MNLTQLRSGDLEVHTELTDEPARAVARRVGAMQHRVRETLKHCNPGCRPPPKARVGPGLLRSRVRSGNKPPPLQGHATPKKK